MDLQNFTRVNEILEFSNTTSTFAKLYQSPFYQFNFPRPYLEDLWELNNHKSTYKGQKDPRGIHPSLLTRMTLFETSNSRVFVSLYLNIPTLL